MLGFVQRYWKFVKSSHSTHVALDQCVPRVYGVKRRTQVLKDQVIMVKTKDKRVKP
jgi:phosphohistidine swiveling domain-containing protein